MKSRPHIVFDALLVSEKYTGVGLASVEYLAELARQDRGFRFTVLVSDRAAFGFLADLDHWQVLVCAPAGGSVLRKAAFTQWRLPRLLREIKADVLHSLQFISPLRSPCPVVLTVHDMAWRLHRETIEQPRRNYYRFMVPRCLQRAAAIFTNSAATAQDVRRCLPGLGAEITVTPFGTPTWLAQYSPAPAATPVSRLNPYYLFVGTLEPRKNLGNLLSAYADVVRHFRENRTVGESAPRLVLAGAKGWQTHEILKAVAKFPEPEQLDWKGYQEPADLAALYNGALALVYPSLYEGFGFPILEAMSVGCPVLTSARGAMAEVAGDAAILVDPLDSAALTGAMLRLAEDAYWRDSWRESGAQRCLNWNWGRTVAASLPIYKQLSS